MTITLTHVRLGLALAALIVWGYGVRVDDSRLRLAGIGLLVVTLVLRFVARQRNTDVESDPGERDEQP